MIKTLKNAWAIEDLRKKMLFTLLIIALYRIGSAIVVPFVNSAELYKYFSSAGDNIFSYLNILGGEAFSKGTLFALGIYPYITASIIIQLLQVAIPYLEKLAKEGGEEGRKKIERITRYTTVGLALIQGWAYYTYLNANNLLVSGAQGNFFAAVVIILSLTAGASITMWLGEKINEKGIGNGISMLLFAGIVASLPTMFEAILNVLDFGTVWGWLGLVIAIAAILVSVGFIVFITESERRIPVQYAKRVVGRKVYGGQSSNLPIKVNMAGVMPVIFASTMVMLPQTIISFFGEPPAGSVRAWIVTNLGMSSVAGAILYLVLILAFSYFYVAISFNPVEVSNNIRKNGGFILGIRPGKPTSDYISRILNKITFMGALFLGIIAIVPILLAVIMPTLRISLSGTSLLIVVGVALETVRDLEAQMMMRHYKGFLD